MRRSKSKTCHKFLILNGKSGNNSNSKKTILQESQHTQVSSSPLSRFHFVSGSIPTLCYGFVKKIPKENTLAVLRCAIKAVSSSFPVLYGWRLWDNKNKTIVKAKEGTIANALPLVDEENIVFLLQGVFILEFQMWVRDSSGAKITSTHCEIL